MSHLRRAVAVTLCLSLLVLTAEPAVFAAENEGAAQAPAPIALGSLRLAAGPGALAAPQLNAAPPDLSAAGLPSSDAAAEAAAATSASASGPSLASAPAPAPGALSALGASPAAPLAQARTSKTTGRLSELAGLTWSKLRWVFDGRPEIRKPAPGEDARLPMSGDHVQLLLVQQGRAPVKTTLAELPGALAHDQDFRSRFNAAGHLRMVLDDRPQRGDLSERNDTAVVGALERAGLSIDVHRARIERVSTIKHAAAPDAPSSPRAVVALRAAVGTAAGLAFAATLGFQSTWMAAIFVGLAASHADRVPSQLVYLARTLRASFKESKRPTIFEWISGLGWKIPPFLYNVFVIYAATYKGHSLAYAAVIALSFGLDFFHGVLIDTWNTLQAKLEAQRGMSYQGVFNFVYGQFWGLVFRGIAYAAVASVTAPWLNLYWAPMITMAIIGMVCGTLGWSGLNALYQKGAISRGTRSFIQALRDGVFMVVGAYFGTDQLHLTIYLFAAQQILDVMIYFWNRRTNTRPLVFVADARLASAPEFNNAYPPRPAVTFAQALTNLQHSPYLKPFVAAARWLAARLKRRG